ncbi:ankyrin repeat domain-containing protein 31 [Pelobates fuscus]|uniref:ankyrin repeat domain-containing protein 31 n=1 Tax=Pelobates fuscus TaxID=191477 RepID=UPI002FE4F126
MTSKRSLRSNNKKIVRSTKTSENSIKTATSDPCFLLKMKNRQKKIKTTKRKHRKPATTKNCSIANHDSFLKLPHNSFLRKNKYGETLLHKAAKQNNIDLVYKLIKAGVNVNALDNAGWTPLHEACVFGHFDVAKCLLEARANVNAKGLGHITPIYDAVKAGHFEIPDSDILYNSMKGNNGDNITAFLNYS